MAYGWETAIIRLMADVEDLWIPLVDEPIGGIVERIERENGDIAALTAEVRAVAEEVAADPKYDDEGPLGPDEETRARFRAFAREHLGS